MMRTTISTVSFTRPFSLPGFSEPHAPGTFEVRTDEERLDTVFEAWRRVLTSLIIVDRGMIQAWSVEPSLLSAALATDSLAAANA